MTSRNGYFPGKTKAKRSAIITPRTAQETQIVSLSEGDSTKYQKSTARSFLTLESPQKTENKAR